MRRELTLRTGPLLFHGMGFSLKDRSAFIGWMAETNAVNIKLIRLVTLTPAWPILRFLNGFYDMDEADVESDI